MNILYYKRKERIFTLFLLNEAFYFEILKLYNINKAKVKWLNLFVIFKFSNKAISN
jgi:hypothetical protein